MDDPSARKVHQPGAVRPIRSGSAGSPWRGGVFRFRFAASIPSVRARMDLLLLLPGVPSALRCTIALVLHRTCAAWEAALDELRIEARRPCGRARADRSPQPASLS